jgi:hypothetical protein
VLSLAPLLAGHAAAASILFVGNSFTFGHGSPLPHYRAAAVTDLNGEGLGGVPALFAAFAAEAGLHDDVSLETHPGVGLDWHLEHERAVIGQRPWDAVVLQSYSTVDAKRPGDPALLVASVRELVAVLRAKNPGVQVWLMATWARADQVYTSGGAWYGKTLEAMTRDIRSAYTLAATGTPGIRGVIPVGDAWLRAIQSGVADANPYDGIDAGKVDLWTYDRYHASLHGYYLEALMVFGSVTGRDPRSLGATECAASELGLASSEVAALEQVAFEQLAADGLIGGAAPAAAQAGSKPAVVAGQASRCAAPAMH